MKYFRVHHMQRSGGHVFCEWLASMVEQPVTWINDVMQTAVDTQITEETIKGQKSVILGFEDLDVEYARRISSVYMNLFWKWPQADLVDIVLVRDPYNLFASRKHFDSECMLGNCSPAAVRLWESHADLIGRYRGKDFHAFCYDTLVSEPEYRDRVAALLGLSAAPWPKTQPRLGAVSEIPGNPLERYKTVHPSFYDELFTDHTRYLARMIR